uniref:Dynein heavy chain hydrolytic ATP-binding dynein motor region domain-containing protein n=1 Tax=Sinocyclocheilus rhinocerous TaxID=307959 RepID=A0A673IY01_9TELE
SFVQKSILVLICLRAIRDVSVPKFLQDDLKLFNGIVSDLFPKIREDFIIVYLLQCFITKCIQLYETTVGRHGLMLVGPSGSGKTKGSFTSTQTSCTAYNMNTVLDDNKKLCLMASPATVSRCGMVYLEPSILGLIPFTECWLRTIPDTFHAISNDLHAVDN